MSIFNRKKQIINEKNITISIVSFNHNGASSVATGLFEYLNKYSLKSSILIDSDFLSPTVDIRLNVPTTPSDIPKANFIGGSLDYVCDAITKNKFSVEVLNELLIKYKKNKVLTGSINLSNLENIWNGDESNIFFNGTGQDSFTYYDKLLEAVRDISNITLVDLSGNILLDSTKYFLHYSDYIIIVVSNNKISLNTTAFYLNHCISNFNLTEDKILVCVNKYNMQGLNIGQIKEYIGNKDVLNEYIPLKNRFDSQINNGSLGAFMEHNRLVFDKIAEKYFFKRNAKIFDNVFRRKEK